MSFEKYKDYKDTDVLWIERIPSHWRPMRLKHACLVFPSNVDKKSYEDQIPVHLCNYTDVYYNEKIVPGMDFMKATATQEQIEKFTLKAGDTIITKDSETADDIGISAFVPNDIPGVICGYHLSMVRPKSCAVGNYVKYFFTSHFAKSKLAVAANGLTRVGLSQYSLDNIYFPTPSIEEQCSIANFLDHETAKIDSLVTEQEKLIELLKEKRQAVISNAVTKGLDPKVKMKHSGVEWLGEIPENWDVRKASNFFTAKKGTQASQLTKEYCSTIEGEYPVYSGQTEKNGVMSEIDTYEFDSGEEGCLFATTVGAKAMTVSHIKGKFSLSQNCMIIISTQSNLSIRFYYYHLQALFLFERALIPDHIQPSFRMEDLYSYRIAVPPLNEQERIVEFLDTKLDNFSKLITEASNSIDLLKERRSALISAAVTGQIDVRNYQPKEVA